MVVVHNSGQQGWTYDAVSGVSGVRGVWGVRGVRGVWLVRVGVAVCGCEALISHALSSHDKMPTIKEQYVSL